MADDHSLSRHYPCYLLQESKIPCVVWFEDALARYGVPTVVFDLYILVQDIDAAAQVLLRSGWMLSPNTKTKMINGVLNTRHRRFVPPRVNDEPDAPAPKLQTAPREQSPPLLPSQKPPRQTTTTILLPAADWNYTFPDNLPNITSATTFYPSLPDLLDALIDNYLDADPDKDRLWTHLGCQVGYLYLYVPAVKERSFASQLKYEHRQFHLDKLSGMSTGAPFTRHQRTIREKLRQGTWELKTCSTERSDETLFNGPVQARLLAAMQEKDRARYIANGQYYMLEGDDEDDLDSEDENS